MQVQTPGHDLNFVHFSWRQGWSGRCAQLTTARACDTLCLLAPLAVAEAVGGQAVDDAEDVAKDGNPNYDDKASFFFRAFRCLTQPSDGCSCDSWLLMTTSVVWSGCDGFHRRLQGERAAGRARHLRAHLSIRLARHPRRDAVPVWWGYVPALPLANKGN